MNRREFMKKSGTLSLLVAVITLSMTLLAKDYDVKQYGAKGDGRTKDTAAIQRAIDAAAKAGGGEVFLPAGVYLSGTLRMKNDIDFHVGPGARLLASPDRGDYNAADEFPQNWASPASGDNTSGGHLVIAVGVRGLTLRGPGVIDGNAAAFHVNPATGQNWGGSKRDVPWRPGQMIEIVDSTDIRIVGLELCGAPYWTCFLFNCTRVGVRGCYIHTDRPGRGAFRVFNGDGLDIDRCQHVTVSDCRIDTEDDSITLRASGAKRLGKPQDCAYVAIDNCILSAYCNAIRFGVGEGRIHDAVLSNLVITDTRNAFNFVGAWSAGSRGTDITDIRIANVRVEADCLLWMMHRHPSEALFRNIVFDGVSAKTKSPALIEANASRPFEKIVLRNVDSPAGYRAVNAEVLEQ